MKAWKDKLQQHVDHWVKRRGEPARFVYHFTDVDNAVGILERRRLYSRNEATRLGLMARDCASADVIANTQQAHRDFARLYFRPQTPTQWNSEGIRPPEAITNLRATCPVPIFFVFDLVELLSRDEVHFSNGNMAAGGVIFGSSLELFESIPFDLVYHSTWIAGHEPKSTILFHRHAEVLVPQSLDITDVAHIYCRSVAEKEMLLHRLSPLTRILFSKRILVSKAPYHREWSYVDEVLVMPAEKTLEIRFNTPRKGTSILPVYVSMEPEGPWTYFVDRSAEKWDTEKPLQINIPPVKSALVTVKICNQVGYMNRLRLADAPF